MARIQCVWVFFLFCSHLIVSFVNHKRFLHMQHSIRQIDVRDAKDSQCATNCENIHQIYYERGLAERCIRFAGWRFFVQSFAANVYLLFPHFSPFFYLSLSPFLCLSLSVSPPPLHVSLTHFPRSLFLSLSHTKKKSAFKEKNIRQEFRRKSIGHFEISAFFAACERNASKRNNFEMEEHTKELRLGECKTNQMQTNCNRINENLLT